MTSQTQAIIKGLGRIFVLIGILFAAFVAINLVVFFIDANNGLRAANTARAQNDIISVMVDIENYKTEYGMHPDASSNASLIKALSGDNPRRIAFFSPRPDQLDSKGELLDPWGSPYKVSVDADSNIHISCAGLDKIFGTADDITNH